MSIFSVLCRAPKTFVSREKYQRNLANQLAMTPQTVNQLRKFDVAANKLLKLEFFFYTNTIAKASALAQALSDLHYTVDYGPSASNRRLQVVTGWSVAIEMNDVVVTGWTKMMTDLGFAHDCEFDGWGTNPKQ